MKRRGISLLEVIFSLSLSTLVLFGLFLLLRGSTHQFELSTAQVFLGQSTREAVDDALHFAASAVTPLVENATMIYSPTAACAEREDRYPNVYSLDFACCCDFLDPRFGENPELTSGYLDRRGTQRFRYRIRFDVTREQLWLERLLEGTPPTVDPAVPPRLLCRNLDRVTFEAAGETIQMTVGAATVRRSTGELQGGLQNTDSRRNLDRNAPREQQARRLQLFTVISIPARTTR